MFLRMSAGYSYDRSKTRLSFGMDQVALAMSALYGMETASMM